MKRVLAMLVALVAASLVSLATARAAIIDYTIAGVGSGSLNGVTFDDASFEILLRGDTANFTFGGDEQINPLERAQVRVQGFGLVTLQIPTRLGFFPGNSAVFFSRAPNGLDLFDFTVAAPVDLSAPFAAVTGTGVFALDQFVDVETTGGPLTFLQSSDVRFSAVAAAVPEPGTWLLMTAGFGLVGGLLRRGRGAVCV